MGGFELWTHIPKGPDVTEPQPPASVQAWTPDEARAPRRSIAIIEAPSVLGLFPRGVELLPGALLACGLGEAVQASERSIVAPPAYSAAHDPATGIKNARTLVSYAVDLADAVGAALDRSKFPLVLGGDCSVLLGPLLALARRGRSGLLFLDGHADFAHPADEPSGEAASMDLALATGRGPKGFGPVGGFQQLISDDRVAVLGYRVHGDGTDSCRGEHITTTEITTIELAELRADGLPQGIRTALLPLIGRDLDGFWLHVDVDVLDDAEMPAVDYRCPGGLSWEELSAIVRASLTTGRTRGMTLTIFNPALDPSGVLAHRLTRFLAECLAAG